MKKIDLQIVDVRLIQGLGGVWNADGYLMLCNEVVDRFGKFGKWIALGDIINLKLSTKRFDGATRVKIRWYDSSIIRWYDRDGGVSDYRPMYPELTSILHGMYGKQPNNTERMLYFSITPG